MTQLSEHFSLAELTHSDTAVRLGLDNTPTPDALLNLSALATTVLEPARAACGVPFTVNDGYRGVAVNREVGGVQHSAHCEGRAADIVPQGIPLAEGFDRIRHADEVPFDQCILESGCVHLACAAEGETPRRQALIRHGTKGNWTYTTATDTEAA